MNFSRVSLSRIVCFAAAALSLSCAPLHAQAPGPSDGGPKLNFSGLGESKPKALPAQRVIQGVVQNNEGQPVKGALVYLKSDREKAVRSMLTDDKGAFRFVQVSRTAEYKLWAQEKEKKGPEKAVSSFETRDDITRNLKIE